ncbi:calcium-binding protein [Synechococcus sp. M16CYN]
MLGTGLDDLASITGNALEIEGLDGDDTIIAVGACDKIKFAGGDGNDSISFSDHLTNADINLGRGADIAKFQGLVGSVAGADGTDWILVSHVAESAKLTGGPSNDTITVNGSATTKSTINGGSGDDSIAVTATLNASTIYGGKQNDVITVTGDITSSIIRGDSNSDTITINAGTLANTFVMGGSENDVIDIISAIATDTTIFGGKGDDLIRLTGPAALSVSADAGNDKIAVTGSGENTIAGGGGSDTIIGGIGAESITGGAGADSILSGDGNDTISAQAGADFIAVQGGNNLIYGGVDADTLSITAGMLGSLDTLNTLKGDAGTDVLLITDIDDSNGTITDLSFKNVTAIETLSITDTDGANDMSITLGSNAQAAGFTTIELNNLYSNGNSVTVNASAYTNGITIHGSDDANAGDILIGGSGADVLYTGADGDGDDLTGGDGADTFVIEGNTGAVSVRDLTTGDAFQLVGTSSTAATATTNGFVATSATSNLGMNSSSATIHAVAGGASGRVDLALASGIQGFTISHIAGTATTLGGSAWDDVIIGLNGVNDTLIGNAGADVLIGGTGADVLIGGSGNDTFTYNILNTSTPATTDAITDWKSADDDVISFDTHDDGATTNDAAVTSNVSNQFLNGMATGTLAARIAGASSFDIATVIFSLAPSFLDNNVAGFIYNDSSYIVHAKIRHTIANIVEITGKTVTAIAEENSADIFTLTV